MRFWVCFLDATGGVLSGKLPELGVWHCERKCISPDYPTKRRKDLLDLHLECGNKRTNNNRLVLIIIYDRKMAYRFQ